EHHIPLEVCPTSNIQLGIYPDLVAHPFRALYDAGVPLTINSDDPPLFNTTLNDEVILLDTAFGLGVSQIDEVLLEGVRCSFLPGERKRQMEGEFRKELAGLKAEHLGEGSSSTR
ncbi:MAG: adenosine deaminase, partial [Chloroflexota bacterium]|nr:adenosine deaminase [Chloroflexota bacterium]